MCVGHGVLPLLMGRLTAHPHKQFLLGVKNKDVLKTNKQKKINKR
jgi:hypothetical protein